jgi:hypothetical protein
MSENKKVKVEFEGSDLMLKVDLNQDGESVIELKLKLVELLDEIGMMVKPKDA